MVGYGWVDLDISPFCTWGTELKEHREKPAAGTQSIIDMNVVSVAVNILQEKQQKIMVDVWKNVIFLVEILVWLKRNSLIEWFT